MYTVIGLDGTEIFKLRKSLSQNPMQHPLIQHCEFVQEFEIGDDEDYDDGEYDDDEPGDVLLGGT